jgi:nitrate reductase (cytochrome), electron transfer subunit
MSHGLLTNCTQCHAESRGAPPVVVATASGAAGRTDMDVLPEPLAVNAFHGLEEPGAGTRAWPGAPPTIPHATWMRESCSACHGTLAEAGLRVSHPWRTNCTQCHAPSARLDQMPVPLSPPTALR